MSLSEHPIIPIGLVILVVSFFYFSVGKRAPDIGDRATTPIDETTWTGIRAKGDKPDATITVQTSDGLTWTFYRYPGGLQYEDKPQLARQSREQVVQYTIHRYPIDWHTDLGLWVGFRVRETTTDNPKGDVGLDAGLRISPVRLAWGTIAPDVLISPRQIGVGCSVYPLAQSVPPFYQKFGVGLAYLADYRGGSGWSPYLSLSTTF